jgi:membrane-associated phospholipid phosphatase
VPTPWSWARKAMSLCNHDETTVSDRWKRLGAGPRETALRRRLARPLAFIRARLSPGGYLGLHLTLGALTLIGAGWLFGGIAEDVVTGDPLTIVDASVAAWFHARTIPLLTLPMLLITHLHGTWSITVLSLALAIVLIRQRAWYWLQALLLVVPGGMLLNVLTKHAFGRARPDFADPILTLNTYSFPSGHVAAATLLYGLLAAIIVTRIDAWRTRVLVGSLALLLITLVALSRVYLGAHYLSDVLAGFAESTAWLALCLTAMHTLRRHRGAGYRG